MKNLLIVFLFIPAFWGRNLNFFSTEFSVQIDHYYSAEGEYINWNITNDSLKIRYNCDFEGCKDTLLFSSAIDEKTSQLYRQKVFKLDLNNLNDNYDKTEMQDGRREEIILKNIYAEEKSIRIRGIKVDAIKRFYQLTDSLILNKTEFKIIQKK